MGVQFSIASSKIATVILHHTVITRCCLVPTAKNVIADLGIGGRREILVTERLATSQYQTAGCAAVIDAATAIATLEGNRPLGDGLAPTAPNIVVAADVVEGGGVTTDIALYRIPRHRAVFVV